MSYLSECGEAHGQVAVDSDVLQESEDRGHGDVELQHLEDQLFHAQHLPLAVCVVCDVHELSDVGRVDLFILPANNVRSKKTSAVLIWTQNFNKLGKD